MTGRMTVHMTGTPDVRGIPIARGIPEAPGIRIGKPGLFRENCEKKWVGIKLINFIEFTIDF